MSDIEKKLQKLVPKLYSYYILYKLGQIKINIRKENNIGIIEFAKNGKVLAEVKIYDKNLVDII